MDGNSAAISKDGQPSSDAEEVLSNEMLMTKCATLLKIAQKAKQAKHEAVTKNKELKQENLELSEKYDKVTSDYKTAREMLSALTEQKLKLSMQLDDLKKEKKQFIEESHSTKVLKEKIEAENSGYRKQYSKLLTENEKLSSKLEDTELKLSKAISLQTDINKLQENNENIKLFCANLTQEKADLGNECSILKEKIFILEKEKDKLSKFMSDALKVIDVDIDVWINKINGLISIKGTQVDKEDAKLSTELNHEREKAKSLNSELESTKMQVTDITNEKEILQEEVEKGSNKIKQLTDRLDALNLDREKLLSNLENMRLETRQLIENCEHLSKEMETVKSQNEKLEEELDLVIDERNCLKKDLNLEISENEKLKECCQKSVEDANESKSKIDALNESNGNMKQECAKWEELVNQKSDQNEELTSTIVSLKEKLKLLEHNLLKSNTELTETKESLSSANSEIQNLKSEVSDSQVKITALVDENREIENLKNHIQVLANEFSEKNLLINNLQVELSNVQNRRIDNESSLSILEQVKLENEELKKDTEEMKVKFEQEQNKLLEKLSESEQKFQDILKKKSEEIKSFKAQVDDLEKNYQLSLKDCDNFKTSIRDDKEVRRKLEIDISKLSKDLNFLSSENEELKNQLKSLKKSQNDQIKELRTNKQELQEILDTHKSEISHYQENIDKLKNTLSLKSEETNTINNELEILQKDHQLLKDSLSTVNIELSSTLEKMEKLQSVQNASEKRIAEVEEENKRLQSALIKEQEISLMLKGELEVKLKEIEAKETCLVSLEDKEKLNSKELKELNNHLDTLSYTITDYKESIEHLKSEVNEKTSELEEKSETIKFLENEQKILQANISELEASLEKSSKEKDEIKTNFKRNKDAGDKLKKLSDAHRRMEEEVAQLRETVKRKSLDLEEHRRCWLGQLTILKGAFSGIKHSHLDIKKHMNEMQTFSKIFPLANIQEKISNCVEHALLTCKQDLLAEMQHMNQALKERGETISKLSDSLAESDQKMKQTVNEISELKENLASKSVTLEEKEKQLRFKDVFIKDLESELYKAREINDTSAEGDLMSISTISKAEESTRLKDVEDSFEDKYTKLKLLAIKLKKRVHELSSTLENDKATWIAEKSELIDKIASLTLIAKNAQIVQESFDSITDKYDEEKKKSKSLEQTIESSLQKEESLKNEINSLEEETKKIPNLKKYLETLDSNLKQTKKDLSFLQKEKEVEIMKNVEFKKENTKLELKVNELSASLEQAQQQSRSNNLLELEIKNYEKTIDDMSVQLKTEKERIKTLKEEIESYASVKNGLEEQIKLLESQLTIEEERNQLNNTQLTTMKSNFEEQQLQLIDQTSRSEQLQAELLEEKEKFEILTVEMSSMSSNFSKKEKDTENQLSVLQRMVDSLEATLKSREEELGLSRCELDRVQREFESYKLRAQSVLAKQKGDTVTQGEREAREQIEKLNSDKNFLTQSIEKLMGELEIQKSESTACAQEKDRGDKKIDELSKILHQKSLDLDKLQSEFRAFKISTETLKQCYKTELEEKETAFQAELATYKDLVDDFKNKLKRAESGDVKGGTHESEEANVPLTTENSLDSLPQEREDGEGSESVPSPHMRKHSNLVPLDVLLNTPYDSESRISMLIERITSLEKELSCHEVRSRHLASLLSEAERESARNLQLNAVLKEEVRRLERSLHRQPHVTNTEYLKNVIFKFMTLQSGDERSRLVPVLDTILKLSPEENQKLVAVAKGETSHSSWGNYLPSWTGL